MLARAHVHSCMFHGNQGLGFEAGRQGLHDGSWSKCLTPTPRPRFPLLLFTPMPACVIPKCVFQGPGRQNFRLSTPPPPKKWCRKWVFSPREPSRALQVTTPPISGVLNSIISLILINQVLGHPKMRFSGSRPTEFPFIQPSPPQTVYLFFHIGLVYFLNALF